MTPIVVQHFVAKRAIARRAAKLLDPGVFIRRNGLAGELASDPGIFFGHDNLPPHGRGGHGGRAATGAAANDEDVGVEFFHKF